MSLDKHSGNESQKENEIPKVKIDTRDLLDDLARKIAREYGIDISEVKKLIASKTETKLESLKQLVSSKQEVLNVQSLKNVIVGAKQVIEKASKEEIENLKVSLDSSDIEERKTFIISSHVFSEETLQHLRNPRNVADNILGAGVGALNSVEATVELLCNIGAGIIKTPYHIYLIVTGKGEYDNFRKI